MPRRARRKLSKMGRVRGGTDRSALDSASARCNICTLPLPCKVHENLCLLKEGRNRKNFANLYRVSNAELMKIVREETAFLCDSSPATSFQETSRPKSSPAISTDRFSRRTGEYKNGNLISSRFRKDKKNPRAGLLCNRRRKDAASTPSEKGRKYAKEKWSSSAYLSPSKMCPLRASQREHPLGLSDFDLVKKETDYLLVETTPVPYARPSTSPAPPSFTFNRDGRFSPESLVISEAHSRRVPSSFVPGPGAYLSYKKSIHACGPSMDRKSPEFSFSSNHRNTDFLPVGEESDLCGFHSSPYDLGRPWSSSSSRHCFSLGAKSGRRRLATDGDGFMVTPVGKYNVRSKSPQGLAFSFGKQRQRPLVPTSPLSPGLPHGVDGSISRFRTTTRSHKSAFKPAHRARFDRSICNINAIQHKRL